MITQTEYLQLVGLLALAKRHNAFLREIGGAALTITGETDYEGKPNTLGHTFDAVWNDEPSADELLRKLDITVVREEQSIGTAEPA